MNTNNEQSDNKKKLLTITTELFLQNIAKRLKIALKKHPSGFTFNIVNLQIKTNFSSELYLVGQREHGKSFKTDPEVHKLIAWLCTNLSAIYSRGGLIGGWWNRDGILFLDVVAVIDSYESAMLSGQVNGEDAIYHPYSNRPIDVNTPQIDFYMPGDA